MNGMRSSHLVPMGGLALAYVAAGRLGLSLDAVGGFATLVWAPTGIALAALVYYGRGLWPAVAAGAFAVNLWNGAAPWVAAGIAAGNTLEAVVGALLLERVAQPKLPLRRLGDVIAFLVLAAGVATAISATVGVASLALGGVVVSADLARTWGAWWLGDAVGAMVVGPALLASTPNDLVSSRGSRSEILALAAALLAASALIFLSGRNVLGPAAFLQAYLLLGPLLWAALRFETKGSAWAILLVTAIAVVGTALGRGPLRGEVLNERLWVLQASIGLMATTFLVLGGLSAARTDAERAMSAAKDAAERSSNAKSRFLAVMSHELRTPLNGIIGYASLLEAKLPADSVPERRHLGRIRDAAWHLTSVIEGILTFSRAEAGREELDLRTFDAADLVREAVALVEPEATRKGLEIRPAASARLEMHSDPGKLRQILLNLVGNEVKFSQRGEVVVEAEDGADGTLVFRVRDEGPGISPERLDTIFVPFNRATDADATITGTGLGLSVCAMLAGLMHGSLTVQSRVGHGTVFTLTVPKDAEMEPNGAPPLLGV
jgi:signal transduction histidine kinase